MNWDIVLSPTVAPSLLWGMSTLALLLIAFSLLKRQRGTLLRGGALAALILTLANPTILEEDRDPIKDVVALVIDNSASQNINDRANLSEAAAAEVRQTLARLDNMDVRELVVTSSPASERDSGTTLFNTLEKGLVDVPPERIAGAILITDGQVHDAPEKISALGFDAPVHTLLTGLPEELDRKLTIERAPRYGIVGETITLTLRVDDYGNTNDLLRRMATLDIRIDGAPSQTRSIITGTSTDITLELEHGGQNVIELEVSSTDNELTTQNNRAVVLINGIRDHLRVLLVSGEPHAGERTWRNLLKADPSVDLVHFTILRPPEKQDGTPIGELSLIEFPTRQLFSIKLDEFDLIIFDRYRRRGVLPLIYLDNVAKFVERGGALLTAAGPAFATPASLYRSPLAGVLPAQPTGDVFTEGYRPNVTLAGHKHPVTSKLPDAGSPLFDEEEATEASWGKWLRLIDSQIVSGNTVMTGPEEKPLLVLDRVGEGRVAQLMSDHAWLWDRGYDGGGPQAEMLRRLAHWLMKEPDLEEEDLTARVQGQTIEITRRTMADYAGSITLTSPSGKIKTVTPEEVEPGVWRATSEADEMGLYNLNDLSLNAVAGVGPLNPKEFSDVRTTDEILAPVSKASDGGLFWLKEDEATTDPAVPSIRTLRAGRTMSGTSWMGLKENNQYTVRSLSQSAILLGPIALILTLGSLLMGWYREGR